MATINRITCCSLFIISIPWLTTGCSQESDTSQGTSRVTQVTEPATELPPVPYANTMQYSIEELMDSVTYRGVSLSADGTRIATSSNASGIYNVVKVLIEGGDVTPLTSSTVDSNFLISWFPADDRILYSADQGGNEMHRIYVRETDGELHNLTPDEGMYMVLFHGWSGDEKSFYVTSNKRDVQHFDLYQISAKDYSEQMIYLNDDLYHIGPVSPDGQIIVLEKDTDNRSRAISLLDLGTGETEKITLSDIHISNHAETFSPDGASLFYTTDKWHEFKYLVRYDLESGEHSEVLRLDWDISGGFGSGRAVRLSEDGNRMAIASNQDARTVIDIYDTASMRRIGGSDTPDASIVSWEYSDDGNMMAYITSNGQVPGDIVLLEVGSAANNRLVSSISEHVNPADLIPGEVVRFTSYDGLTVPGILYQPVHASSENKVPALVWVHGGPGGETRIGYNPLFQYLANHGYAVYGVNNRGSSGSGKAFFHLDDQDHGGGDLRDIVAAKQFLIETGWVNPEQVGVIGASYGGFMVLAAMAFHPEVFDVAVDIFGVANWVRTLANTPPWWASRRMALQTEMGDFQDETHWRARSPVFHAGNITRPLIVLQGENDPRVIKPESDAMVAEVQKNGTPVEYVVFDDEGHGFRKKKNEITGYTAILEFLDEHLKGIGKG